MPACIIMRPERGLNVMCGLPDVSEVFRAVGRKYDGKTRLC